MLKCSKKKGFKVYVRYFDNKLVKYLSKNHNKFDLIFSANTITHINNIEKVLRNIKKFFLMRVYFFGGAFIFRML